MSSRDEVSCLHVTVLSVTSATNRPTKVNPDGSRRERWFNAGHGLELFYFILKENFLFLPLLHTKQGRRG